MLLLKFMIFHVPIVWHVWMKPPKRFVSCVDAHWIKKEFVFLDIQGLIKAAIDVDVTVFSSSEIFICTANCYRRLIRFEKISNNLCNLKKRNQERLRERGIGSKN